MDGRPRACLVGEEAKLLRWPFLTSSHSKNDIWIWWGTHRTSLGAPQRARCPDTVAKGEEALEMEGSLPVEALWLPPLPAGRTCCIVPGLAEVQ